MELGRQDSIQHQLRTPPPPPPPVAVITTANRHNNFDNKDKDNEGYLKSKSQWSFTLSTTINKPIDVVIRQIGGLDNFEKLMWVNPVCMEYKEVGRDWVGLGVKSTGGGLESARVREMGGLSESEYSNATEAKPAAAGQGRGSSNGNNDNDKEGRYYRRISFEGKNSVRALWGLFQDVSMERGTFVWDEEGRVGVWEVKALSLPCARKELDSWARKVVRFSSVVGGDGSADAAATKIEEFVEGYTRETKVLEWATKRYTRILHSNWIKKYEDILDD